MVQSDIEQYKEQIKSIMDKLQALLTEMDNIEYGESNILTDSPALDVDDSTAQEWYDSLLACEETIATVVNDVGDHV